MNRMKVRPEIIRTHHISTCSTSSDLPLKTTFSNGSYTDDYECGTNGLAVPPRFEMDGQSRNTVDNMSVAGTLDIYEDRSDSLKGTPPSWLLAILFLMCLISVVALVLSLLMLTGKVNSKCGCYSSKG